MKKKVLLVLLLVGFFGYGLYRWQISPYGAGATVYLAKGMTVSTMAKELETKGVLRNQWVFLVLVRIKDVGARLQPGEYAFPPQQTPEQVLDRIVQGQRIVHKLVIPEGYNFKQIAQAIGKTGIATEEQVLTKFRDPFLLNKLDFPAVSLEGYLFPATYPYDRGTTLDELLSQMLKTFLANYNSSMREQTSALGWTIPQVVTLASIIEKETNRTEERNLISGVFHNRLRQKMLLQTDPTVIYGLNNFDGNIRKADLANPHSYNTYIHPGLPPGPIASPGQASILAALNPNPTTFLYFVAKRDGSHHFSSTLQEHQAAVHHYQIKPLTLPSNTP